MGRRYGPRTLTASQLPERLWAIFGPAWGWPKETMTFEEDRIDLLRHEKEIAAHQSFNYALLDRAETAILGCVHIDPPERVGADGEISSFLRAVAPPTRRRAVGSINVRRG